MVALLISSYCCCQDLAPGPGDSTERATRFSVSVQVEQSKGRPKKGVLPAVVLAHPSGASMHLDKRDQCKSDTRDAADHAIEHVCYG